MLVLTPDPRTHHRLEIEFAHPGLPGNPCDSRELALDVEITDPQGVTVTVPGFAHVPYALDPAADDPDGPDRATVSGPQVFRLRWRPTHPGAHRIRPRFTVAGTRTVHGEEAAVGVRAAGQADDIAIGPSGWAFQTADGRPWFPIGANICWPNMMRHFRGQKLADFRAMLERLAANGGTAFRLWANAPWAWAIDWSGPEKETLRFGELNHAGCARLDAVVEMAEELGLRIMFCIDAANNWAGGNLAGSPYALANGGPCATTADYFNLPAARAMTREKMRQVAARWGASSAIWCWELWNEVDGCGPDHTTGHQQLAWHEEMIGALRGADTAGHLVTTSTGHPLNFSAMWRLPGIDFTQTHHYGFRDSVDHLAPVLSGYHDDALRLYGKPHLGGELGTCFASNQDEFDRDGRTLHVALWGGVLKPRACAPGLLWFWDGYIHRHDLYGAFRGIAAFLAGEPWNRVVTGSLLAEVTGEAAVREHRPPATRKIPTTLSGRDFHQAAFTVPGRGPVAGAHLIPNTWYGWDRPESHTTGAFLVEQPEAGEFVLRVWGGGTLTNGIVAGAGAGVKPEVEITVDGAVALRREVLITAQPGATDRYTDRIAVPLSAGRHRVTVRNAGGGCFITGHLLLTNQLIAEPRIWLQGLRWPGHARLWLCDLEHGWAATGEPASISGLHVRLDGLEPGPWQADWWDTRAGTVIGHDRLTVDGAGTGQLVVPEFRRDVAAKLRRCDP